MFSEGLRTIQSLHPSCVTLAVSFWQGKIIAAASRDANIMDFPCSILKPPHLEHCIIILLGCLDELAVRDGSRISALSNMIIITLY